MRTPYQPTPMQFASPSYSAEPGKRRVDKDALRPRIAIKRAITGRLEPVLQSLIELHQPLGVMCDAQGFCPCPCAGA
jgi:hypothetical protein